MSNEENNEAEAVVDAVESQEVESQENSEELVEALSDSEEVVEVQAESEEELETEIKDAIEEGATEEEVKDMIRQFTLKVNGKEIVKELDMSDEEAIRKELQLAYAGRQSMQESAELKKLYGQEIERLRTDPFAVLKELELDPLALSADYIDRYLKENEMSDEEKASIKQQDEYKQLKEENERLKREHETKLRQEQVAQLEREIETDILSALEGDAELIADRETIALVADNLIWAAENNIEVSAKDVLPTVKKQLRDQFRNATARFKSTAILKDYMGDELMNKLREERLQQVKSQPNNVSSIQQTSQGQKPKEEVKKKVNLSDLFR